MALIGIVTDPKLILTKNKTITPMARSKNKVVFRVVFCKGIRVITIILMVQRKKASGLALIPDG
jgi:hypothetical protein